MDDSELDSEMSPSQTQGALQSIATKVSDLVNQVAQKTGLVATLQSQLENEQVTIGTLQEVNHTLESEIIHLKEEIAKQAQQQQQLVQQEQRGTTVMQQSSDDFSFALSPIKDADGRLTLGMHQSFYGASQQGASKNVLKTYMDNQLELNKAEFEMYETDINKLADQLEATMSERDNLIEKNQSLAQERESLQDTIQALRDTIEHQISENTEELVRASPYSVIRAANPADVDADKTEVYDDTWRVSLENDIALEDTNAEPGDAESSTPDIATLLDKLRELKELTEYYETELNIKNLELEYAEQAMVEIREKVKEQLMDQENRSPGRISSSPDQTDSDAVGAELRRIEAELELKTKELALAEQSIEDITQHWQQTSKSLHEQVEIDVQKLALQSDDHAKVVVALQNDLAIKQQDFDRISNEVARLQQLLEENMRISDQLSNEKLTYEEKIRTLEEHLTEANRQLLEHRSKVQDQDTLITQLQLKQTKLQETVSNFTFNSNDIYIATLQTELESLRDEVETKASELDILRSKELRYGTMESIHQMDIEQLEAKYQSIIDGLQQKLEESKAVYDAVSAAGASTEDNELINQANQELIKKLEESNTAAIQMIEELKSEKSRLIERVEGLLADLEESNELGQQQAIEIDTFKDKLTELSEEYETAQLRFDEERDEFESIKNALQDRLDQASNATSSEVDQLNHRVSSIQNDKDELEKHFHSQQSKIAELEANIMCQARNIQTSGQSMEMVQSALVQYRAYFSLQEEELLKHCNLRYNRFAEKVQHLHNTIQSYASTLQKSNHGLQINLETMQQDLQRTQRDLEISREETQLLNSLKETLYRDLEQQQYEKEALEEAIQDLERDNDQRVFLNQSQEKQAVAEDVATLKLKLEDAENSVLELSQNGANLFAKTTRTITYLESECTRFRSLLDHFKLVNLQLTSDLQQAHEEGMRAQSFENRLKLTLENENKLLGRIQLLESTAAQREKEHAKVLMDQQQETEKRVDEMHSELNVLSEKLQHVQTEYHTNVQALLDEKEARITIEEIFMQEKAQLRNKYSEADAERQLLAHRIEESELSCAALQVLVDEKESMLQEMENKVIQLTKESQHLGVNWDKKYSEYEQENRTFLAKINLIEEQLHVAQQDLHQSELSNLSKDEALAASVTNHLAVMDENRNLHAQLLASTTELDSFRTLSEEQQRRVETLVQELESLKAQYIILRDQTHRDTMNKLTLSEDLIRFDYIDQISIKLN